MKSLLQIGNEKEVIGAVAESVVTILRQGHETHSEQETIREALKVMSSLSHVSNITVTNSTFTGDLKSDSANGIGVGTPNPTVEEEEDEEED